MTLSLEKTEALAVCFRNLKGPKNKDLLSTARALKYLKELPEFGSNRSLGEAVGVSGEIVRQFISLLDLPDSIQGYIEQGKLGLEQGRRLQQLIRRRPDVAKDAARVVCSMTAMETRDLVEYLIRTPTDSVDDALNAIGEARTQIAEEYHIDAILDGESFRLMTTHAEAKGISVNNLVTVIVNSWLEGHSDDQLL